MTNAKSKVSFVPLPAAATPEQMAAAAEKLWEAMGLDSIIPDKGLVAIKQHFGEKGGANFVPPAVARAIGRAHPARPAASRSSPTPTRSTTACRANAVDHLELAREHGFTHEALGFPVIIADGLKGESQVTLPRPGRGPGARVPRRGGLHGRRRHRAHARHRPPGGRASARPSRTSPWASPAGRASSSSTTPPSRSSTTSKCKACGRCTSHCPPGAISLQPVTDGR